MSDYNKVRSYTDKQLLDRVKSLSNFKGIPKGKWLLGVRSNEDTPNIFDDKVYLFDEEKFILVTSITTNPGTPSLLGGWKKVSKKGSFVLKADYWHHNIWTYGLHKDKMPALLQLGNSVVGYRDNNNNNKAEEIGTEDKGYFGINFHFNSYEVFQGGVWNTVKNIWNWTIGGWSEGCQVANKKDDYKKIIGLCKNQKTVNYCLINEF